MHFIYRLTAIAFLISPLRPLTTVIVKFKAINQCSSSDPSAPWRPAVISAPVDWRSLSVSMGPVCPLRRSPILALWLQTVTYTQQRPPPVALCWGNTLGLLGYFLWWVAHLCFGLARGPITLPGPAMVLMDQRDLNSKAKKIC